MGTYSEGVRQALWHHHHNRSGFKVVGKSATYKQDYLTSQFCAAPPPPAALAAFSAAAACDAATW